MEISLKTSLCSTPGTPAKGYEAIMTWYAAHIILLTKFLDGVQDSYPIWENVVLIKKGEAEASVGSHSHNGRPAVWVYAGTRKLNECLEYFDPAERVPDGTEEYGTEVTYSSFVLPDEEAMQKLLANRDVTVLYEGIEPEERRAN